MNASSEPGPRIARLFAHIQQQRMQGVPLLNDQLWVEPIGFHRHDTHWLGTLITPWFMSLILQPDEELQVEQLEVGFPAGIYPFDLIRESEAGQLFGCSLFSPMDEFDSQEFARATARAALDALYQPLDQEFTPRRLTRRALLRGAWS